MIACTMAYAVNIIMSTWKNNKKGFESESILVAPSFKPALRGVFWSWFTSRDSASSSKLSLWLNGQMEFSLLQLSVPHCCLYLCLYLCLHPYSQTDLFALEPKHVPTRKRTANQVARSRPKGLTQSYFLHHGPRGGENWKQLENGTFRQLELRQVVAEMNMRKRTISETS